MNHSKPQGKGFGDGTKVMAANEKRTVNPENTYTGFRPRVGEVEGHYWFIRNKWCKRDDIRRSFSAIFNSLMPGIRAACEHTTEIDANGNVSIEANFGRIVIE